MHYKITAPVGHTGLVAGVYFADGVATCCHPPMGGVEFLRRHGYAVVAVGRDECHHHHAHCHHDHGHEAGEDADGRPVKTSRGGRRTKTPADTTTAAAGDG